MQKLTLIVLALLWVTTFQAQIIFEENFESNTLPSDWTQMTNASDGGWLLGSGPSLSSSYFEIEDNGGQIMATNDDGCNCDKSEDYLILPAQDFSDTQFPIFECQLFYNGNDYAGDSEEAFIEVSTDGGDNWVVVEEIPGNPGWRSYAADLSAYAGMNNVLVAIHYDDNGGWLYGIAIDDVVIKEPLAFDVELTSVDLKSFGETTDAFPIKGNLVNKGSNTINSFDLSYRIDGAMPIIYNVENVAIESFESYEFLHNQDWIPTEAGTYAIDIAISNINGQMDGDESNNSLSFSIDIFDKVVAPNIIDDYIDFLPVVQEVASSTEGLDKPTDLDFFPILGKNELWVINERTEDEGGSTVTFYEVGTDGQEALERIDGNAWHFMSLPTGIAFSETEFFATSPGVLDANHSGGDFTGPTLWTSDAEIYARPSGGNGSHMDMLHGSPRSMGIAHEVDNVYWVYDGHNDHPVRYDFVEDHGPGAADHSDGRIRRYTEIELKREGAIPSHLILDKPTGWLYMNDVGNDRVLRLNINSGSVAQTLFETNEPLAEHSEMGGVEWEVIIESGLEQPCGIELIENRLLVGDYATGDIVIYDIDNNFEELGRIETGSEGLTGLKVGPDGRIWFTNRLLNQLSVISVDDAVHTDKFSNAVGVSVSPNPTSENIQVRFEQPFDGTIELLQLDGKSLQRYAVNGQAFSTSLNKFDAGLYLLRFANQEGSFTKKISLIK